MPLYATVEHLQISILDRVLICKFSFLTVPMEHNMHVNANLERTRTVSVTDLSTAEHDRKLAERKRQAERYEARHGTAGKRSVFAAEGNSGTNRANHAADRRAYP